MHAMIEDYPLGGSKRGQCTFSVERSKGKVRAVRTTTGKPKLDTYCSKLVFVDGDDGRTYIIKGGNHTEMIVVSRSDFKNATSDVMGEGTSGAVWPGNIRYEELRTLLDEGWKEE